MRQWTYRDELRLHERIIDVSRREKDYGERDQDVFVCVIQGVCVVSIQ